MTVLGFYKFILPLKENMFDELSNSVDFEDITKGRKGNVLVNVGDKGVPIVRTTTKYTKPAHDFSAIHKMIVEKIKHVANDHQIQTDSLLFNNALIEIYDHNYTKMKYHSDQALDLDATSYVALFSCYKQPKHHEEQALRKLKVKDKTTDEEFTFTLENNSVILFSLSTNTKFLHKIVLEPVSGKKLEETENQWLGITFRQSKTFIQFKNNQAYFTDGALLQLADDTQRKEFYRLRGEENRSMDFTYPMLTYTLSESDIMMPQNGFKL